MHFFEFIVVIVVVGCVFSFLKQLLRTQKNKPQQAAVNDELEQELAQIKQRLATLEKIVTDKTYNLKREIDDL